MSIREFVKLVAPYIPTIKKPIKELDFKERLKYTLLVLVGYFILSSTYLIGLSEVVFKRFELMSQILAASMGTIISLGIGPIISGMIVFELLVSAGYIRLNLQNPEDRAIFETLQKLFAILFIIYENAVLVFSGWLLPKEFAPFPIPQLFLLFQLILGGILLMLLDEISQYYGLFPGISLFIAASISKALVIQLVNPIIPEGSDYPAGKLLSAILFLLRGDLFNFILSALPIITTIVIFLLVSYLLLVRVELPFHIRSPYGYITKFPLSLFYTSNIPVIFAAAFLGVIQFFASIFANSNIPIISNISSFILGVIHHKTILDFITNPSLIYDPIVWLQIIFYFLYFLVFGVIFSIMWIEVSEQSPEKLAEAIFPYVYLPGARPNKRFVLEVVKRYVYPLAILGGALVGLLAAFADFLGALARGTSILLLILILNNFYERVARIYFKDLESILKFIGIKVPIRSR